MLVTFAVVVGAPRGKDLSCDNPPASHAATDVLGATSSFTAVLRELLAARSSIGERRRDPTSCALPESWLKIPSSEPFGRPRRHRKGTQLDQRRSARNAH